MEVDFNNMHCHCHQRDEKYAHIYSVETIILKLKEINKKELNNYKPSSRISFFVSSFGINSIIFHLRTLHLS